MSFNPGPLISTTTAAIIHNQRVNKNDDKETNISCEVGKVMTDYKSISSPKEILEELKKILEQDKCKEEDSVSMYYIVKLMRKKYDECQSLDRHLRWAISDLTGKNSIFLNIDFNCENKELIVSERGSKIFFKKQKQNLNVVMQMIYWENVAIKFLNVMINL